MKSQADRMLEALTDCEWHAIGELHNSWGIGRPNSRANDLRGRGLEIEYRRVPGETNANVAHQYRLARPLEEVASACDVGAASSSVPNEGETLFWSKVDRRSPDDCWLWLASRNPDGYGEFWRPKGESRRAHVIAYQFVVGPVPEGLELDHLCRNRSCCNPSHLEAVTHQENMKRAAATITSCPKGHEYTAETTMIKTRTDGRKARACRVCDRESSKMRRRDQRLSAKASGSAGTITADTPSSRVSVRGDVPQSVESSGVEPLALFDLPRGAYQEPEAA